MTQEELDLLYLFRSIAETERPSIIRVIRALLPPDEKKEEPEESGEPD
jgi:hypothetical protein